MPPADLSLLELSQRQAQKQAELEEARRAFEGRREELVRRREELVAQLQTVEAEIAAARVPNTEPLAPAGQPAPVAPAPEPPASQSPIQGGMTLSRFLEDLVQQAGRPITVKELTEKVVQDQFPTTSRDIPKLVKNKVSELVKRGVLQRKGAAGVVFVKERAKPAVGATKAQRSRKAASSNGKVPPAGKKLREPLSALLLRLLDASDEPLRAKELADRARAAGYQTESKDFTNVVWVALGNLVKQEKVENIPNRGYQLKRRTT